MVLVLLLETGWRIEYEYEYEYRRWLSTSTKMQQIASINVQTSVAFSEKCRFLTLLAERRLRRVATHPPTEKLRRFRRKLSEVRVGAQRRGGKSYLADQRRCPSRRSWRGRLTGQRQLAVDRNPKRKRGNNVAVHGETRAVENLASEFVFNARIKFAKFAMATRSNDARPTRT
jgi:hypothetical protein